MGEILSVKQLDVKAAHEPIHDHLWCFTLSVGEFFLRAMRHNTLLAFTTWLVFLFSFIILSLELGHLRNHPR